MQGKGIVRFFLIAMTIVCLYQYSLMIPTQRVEKKADAYAEKISQQGTTDQEKFELAKEARVEYLDSVSNEVIFKIPLFKEYTYQELKAQQLALGLDLKGGLSTLLQVDLEEFLVSMSKNSKDPDFLAAIADAETKQKNSQSDFITLFGNAWKEQNNGKNLSEIFARNQTLAEDINFQSNDSEVISTLRSKADETVDLTYKRLKDRIDKLGVTQPNVTLDDGRDLILVELPGVDNPERAKNLLQSQAKLEFWDVYRYNEGGILDALIQADGILKAEKQEAAGDSTFSVDEPTIVFDTIVEPILDSLGNKIKDTTRIIEREQGPEFEAGPLLTMLQLNVNGNLGLPVFGAARKNQMDNITDLLVREEVQALLPSDLKLLWEKDPIKNFETGETTDSYRLFGIRTPRGGATEAPLTGDHVTNASAQPDPITGNVTVSLRMDNQGARIWADMTTKAAQANNKEIAIVLDDEVVSAPSVNGPITGGNSSITGSFSIQEGKDLANMLQVGKLPTKTKIIQESVVGPSLGKENIRKSLTSLLIGFLIVLFFMIAYYGRGGIVSVMALFANLFFIFGALASFGTVLTLPGIAGIVLTIGMAVDANVIIYERIREELRAGKAMKTAIKDGYTNSYSAIIDANVTTILVAIVLAYFGIGPIKGFAVVLIIGVIFSLITAVMLTRIIIDNWIAKDRPLNFWTNFSERFLVAPNFDWIGKRKRAYITSGIIILIGLISMFTRGFDLSIDFKGGYSYNVEFAEGLNVSADQIRESLAEPLGGQPLVKAVDAHNTYNIVTDYLIDDTADDAETRVKAALYTGINALAGGDIDQEMFGMTDAPGTHVTSSSKVGPTIADDIKNSSVIATVLALSLIFIYLLIRFTKWQFSLGAIVALIHDTLIVLSVFSLLHGIVPWAMEIDQAFIAALLTVIGYSINDTVIVFDRIREFFNTYVRKSKKEVFNSAINQTISRTLITSLTTFFVVFVLFLFGGSSIKGFAFALMIGIIVGTYSSVFIASPVVYDTLPEQVETETKKGSKKKKPATSKA